MRAVLRDPGADTVELLWSKVTVTEPAVTPWPAVTDMRPHAHAPVAVGGSLDPGFLVEAYRHGLFPWPTEDAAVAAMLVNEYGDAVASGAIPNLSPGRRPTLSLPWWSPDPRCVVTVENVRASRSLRPVLRRSSWTTTLDAAFDEVVDRCRHHAGPTWLTAELVAAFGATHRAGDAHSVEVWAGNELIGGLFGILVGGVFSAESMFRSVDAASKVAVLDVVDRLRRGGGSLLDAQFPAAHLHALGGEDWRRVRYHAVLNRAGHRDVSLAGGRLPVHRLAVVNR